MKFERVNDHQIRCTLTKSDLADRELKLSELAYGSEKAKSLFRDMMQQASFELGFEADNIPLMIEAIPLSSESILFVITKVEDPEELDTRFANFAPSIHSEEDNDIQDMINRVSDEIPDVLDLFKKFSKECAHDGKPSESTKDIIDKAEEVTKLSRSFSFETLSDVIKAAKVISKFFAGNSSLYKDEANDSYVLSVSKSEHTTEEFNRVCNVLSEYGEMMSASSATEAYFLEHDSCIVSDTAVETLTV